MAKICKQCGETRPLEQFREYYGGRKGRYNTCKMCEKINSRYKYLVGKSDKCSLEETDELRKINALYQMQRKIGLQPPKHDNGRAIPLVESLDDMLSKYEARAAAVTEVVGDGATNDELTHWLTVDLTEDPERYLDDIYEGLKTKFRPVLRVDAATNLPVYDDTYKAVLEKILDRFNDYEDNYYND